MEIKNKKKAPCKHLPIIKVHHGTCDICHRKHILVVHYNYHISPKNSFRICNSCYIKGQIIRLVQNGFIELEEGEIYE